MTKNMCRTMFGTCASPKMHVEHKTSTRSYKTHHIQKKPIPAFFWGGSTNFFSVNPAVQVAGVNQDALAKANVGEVAAPDHLPDGPVAYGEVAGRIGQGTEPARKERLRGIFPPSHGGRIG